MSLNKLREPFVIPDTEYTLISSAHIEFTGHDWVENTMKKLLGAEHLFPWIMRKYNQN